MKTYDELLAENAAFASQVEVLRKAALNAISLMPGGESKAQLRDAYDATPSQCLTEIKAEAGLVGYFRGTDDAWRDLTGGPSPEQMTAHRAIEYSNQVRQGEQSGTWLKDSNVNGGKRGGDK